MRCLKIIAVAFENGFDIGEWVNATKFSYRDTKEKSCNPVSADK